MGGERGFHEWGDVYLGNSEISYLVHSIFESTIKQLGWSEIQKFHFKIILIRTNCSIQALLRKVLCKDNDDI